MPQDVLIVYILSRKYTEHAALLAAGEPEIEEATYNGTYSSLLAAAAGLIRAALNRRAGAKRQKQALHMLNETMMLIRQRWAFNASERLQISYFSFCLEGANRTGLSNRQATTFTPFLGAMRSTVNCTVPGAAKGTRHAGLANSAK